MRTNLLSHRLVQNPKSFGASGCFGWHTSVEYPQKSGHTRTREKLLESPCPNQELRYTDRRKCTPHRVEQYLSKTDISCIWPSKTKTSQHENHCDFHQSKRTMKISGLAIAFLHFARWEIHWLSASVQLFEDMSSLVVETQSVFHGSHLSRVM